MFKRKKVIHGLNAPKVKISIYRDVIEAIFDECEQHEVDETGGRIIGFYHQNKGKLEIEVCGMIGPGPNAHRTSTSLFQDGGYQEVVFRRFEAKYPDIEHLGNWHTHHVNGLDALSTGDIDTYNRIVNHKNHNTDFFYALLVVAKNHGHRRDRRYSVKHFLIHRGNPTVYEIPATKIKIVNKSPFLVDKEQITAFEKKSIHVIGDDHRFKINQIRIEDKKILFEMYPDLKTFLSKKLDNLYWRGKLDLIDDTSVEILVMESIDGDTPSYTITLTGSDAKLFQTNQLYANRNFESARKAIWLFERDLNRELLNKIKKVELFKSGES